MDRTVPVNRITIYLQRAHGSDDFFCTLCLELAVSVEEPHWDMFRAYRTLASFCTFNYTERRYFKNDREVETGYEHTFLYCDRRRSGGIGVMRGVISDFFKPVRRSLLPFIPGVEEKSQVQRSIGVLSECGYQLC